ncbi:phosphoesterase RecJ-like protein [Caldalkalibacillus uzonensis]|uniref:Phosphoesterase RecJ-like protein n=1 Tax=Caldalkalibacillus uzonensis TaxID=353224 RepID=A0ABU0CN41_9BACI|nr:bifunctional oligoribonuclease/PAP phosphatase NrnA [Caldalkalibacillus uzonensis]MDQ0337306.1 phosphoesterase RecJ-like protein [Caldalkalibacillus uzonensis]
MQTYRQALAQASQFIKDHDQFLVVSHVNPDGDATGSVLAVAHLLHFLGKSYMLVNEGASPRRFSFLKGFEQIINLSETPVDQRFRYVIAVDVADQERLGEIGPLFSDDAELLNIDHHPTNTRFGQVNVIQPEAASTTEILYDLCQRHFQQAFAPDLAEALYTGLLTDTGGFRYANTTHKVLEMAADLLTYNLRPAKIAQYALETITTGHIKILKQALDTLTFAYEQQVALMSVSLEAIHQTGVDRDDIDGLVGYPSNIAGVKVGILLKEVEQGQVKVSLRSRDTVNVAEIAQVFGGGGHAKAAGFTYRGTLAEAKQALLAKLEEVLH